MRLAFPPVGVYLSGNVIDEGSIDANDNTDGNNLDSFRMANSCGRQAVDRRGMPGLLGAWRADQKLSLACDQGRRSGPKIR